MHTDRDLKEITQNLIALKDLEQDPKSHHKVKSWIKYKKLPTVTPSQSTEPPQEFEIPNQSESNQLTQEAGKLSKESKHRGVPPAYISQFFLRRMLSDESDSKKSLDVLGSVTIGHLAEHLTINYHKELFNKNQKGDPAKERVYLLTKEFNTIPVHEFRMTIWIPPADLLLSKDGSNEMIQTLNEYSKQLGSFFFICPKSFLGHPSIKKFRRKLFESASYCVVLKYSTHLNAVCFQITNKPKKAISNNQRPTIPCYFHLDLSGGSKGDKYHYQNYFGSLADKITSNTFKKGWSIALDEQKAVIFPNAAETLGDLINVNYFIKSKNAPKQDEEVIDGLTYLKTTPAPEKDLRNRMVHSGDFVLPSRSPLRIITPEDSRILVIKSGYFLISLNQAEMKRRNIAVHDIRLSITTFIKNNEDELRTLLALSPKMFDKIELIKSEEGTNN